MPVKKQKITVDTKTIGKYVQEYDELSKKIKLLDERKKSLGDIIKSFASENGTKDDKGSFYCSNDYFTFGSQCKKSVSLNEEKAKELIKSKGFDECLKTVITVDEEALEKRCSTGDITPKELENITNVKTTYAVTVKAKEDMPEVEQTEVVAASRKPKKLLRK